jgi:hypothetical protein
MFGLPFDGVDRACRDCDVFLNSAWRSAGRRWEVLYSQPLAWVKMSCSLLDKVASMYRSGGSSKMCGR